MAYGPLLQPSALTGMTALTLAAGVLQGRVLTPSEAALVEPLAPPPLQLLLTWASRQPPAVMMGASLKHLVRPCWIAV